MRSRAQAYGLMLASGLLAAVAVAQAPRDGLFSQDGRPLPNPRPLLYSTSNANDRFRLWVRWPLGQCGAMRLIMGGTAITANSYGSDAEACSSSIELDAAQATQAAALLRIARQDRQPIGEAVVARFSAARRYRAGQRIQIALDLENPAGAPPVSFHHGGRNRGPRDDQWDFEITRNGRAVRRMDAMNFGGLSTYDALPPGAVVRVGEVPLAAWGDVSLPGRYEVRCSYETSMAASGVNVHTDTTRAAIWDRRFEGVVRFTVR